jgi:hypothetical protein
VQCLNYFAEQARQAAIQLIVDIVLTLLSFIPFGGLLSVAARAARTLLPVFRSARVTRSIARGLEKALDGAMDAKNIRATDELLSPTALSGRGRIGRALDRIQEACLQCEETDYIGTALDFWDLAQPFLQPDSLSRRSLSNSAVLSSKENDTGIADPTLFSAGDQLDHILHPRAGTTSNQPCIFESGVCPSLSSCIVLKVHFRSLLVN